jgi:hypothetical protein
MCFAGLNGIFDESAHRFEMKTPGNAGGFEHLLNHNPQSHHRNPPEMNSVSPVIHFESSDAKNTAAGAISSG